MFFDDRQRNTHYLSVRRGHPCPPGLAGPPKPRGKECFRRSRTERALTLGATRLSLAPWSRWPTKAARNRVFLTIANGTLVRSRGDAAILVPVVSLAHQSRWKKSVFDDRQRNTRYLSRRRGHPGDRGAVGRTKPPENWNLFVTNETLTTHRCGSGAVKSSVPLASQSRREKMLKNAERYPCLPSGAARPPCPLRSRWPTKAPDENASLVLVLFLRGKTITRESTEK